MKIVVTDAKMKIMQSVRSDLDALGDIVVTEKDDEDTLVQAVAGADLIVICYSQITRNVIKAGNKLKAILKWGVRMLDNGMTYSKRRKTGLKSSQINFR